MKRIKKVEESSALIGKVFDSFETDSHQDAPSIHAVRNAISNPNLVINANFQVWQRGTEFNNIGNAVYCADRWRVYRKATGTANIIKVSNGLQVTGDFKGQFNIYQAVDKDEYAWLVGKQTIVTECINGIERKYVRKMEIVNNTNYINIVSVNGLTPGDVVNWVKVELGSIATPFIPRLYDEEVLLCKRYFKLCNVIAGFEYKYPGNLSTVVLCMGFNEMRSIPTIYSFKAQGTSGGNPTYSYRTDIVKMTSSSLRSISVFNANIDTTCYAANVEIVLDAEIY